MGNYQQTMRQYQTQAMGNLGGALGVGTGSNTLVWNYEQMAYDIPTITIRAEAFKANTAFDWLDKRIQEMCDKAGLR